MQRYAIQPCDTLYGISNRFGVTLPQLLAVNSQINNSKPIFFGQIINIPNYTYTVRPGDTLNKIAKQFNVPLNLIISINPQILCRKYITVGQEIFITGVPAPINAPSNPTPSVTPPSKVKKAAPPKQIEAVESNSEDIVDDINNNDWINAQNRVDQIKLNISELIPMLVAASIPSNLIDGITAAVSNLEKEVKSKKNYESKVQANRITKYIPDISDYYIVVLPTDLGRLDYLGREIALNADVEDWASASSNYEKTKNIWGNLKTKLSPIYKNDADKYQNSIDNLNKYINQKDAVLTKKEANILLDLTDVLETDFTKQIKG